MSLLQAREMRTEGELSPSVLFVYGTDLFARKPVGNPVPPDPAQPPRPLFSVYGASRPRPVVRLYVVDWLVGDPLGSAGLDWTWCRSFRKLGQAGVLSQERAGDGLSAIVMVMVIRRMAHGGGAVAYVSLLQGSCPRTSSRHCM